MHFFHKPRIDKPRGERDWRETLDKTTIPGLLINQQLARGAAAMQEKKRAARGEIVAADRICACLAWPAASPRGNAEEALDKARENPREYI